MLMATPHIGGTQARGVVPMRDPPNDVSRTAPVEYFICSNCKGVCVGGATPIIGGE